MIPNGMQPTGGKREGSGRKSDAIRHRFQRILEEAHAYERLKKIMIHTTDDEIFMKALQITLERGYGKPLQELKSVDDNGNYQPFVVMLAPQSNGIGGHVGT